MDKRADTVDNMLEMCTGNFSADLANMATVEVCP